MNYKVWDSKRGHIFASYDEAKAYCDWLIVEKNLFVLMTTTNAKATHTFNIT